MAKVSGSVWIEVHRINWIDTNGNTRIITGADEGDRTGDGAIMGSMWVEGDNFHYIDHDNHERKIQGLGLVPVVGAKPGSIWVQAVAHQLRWITESSNKVAAVGGF